MNVLDVSIKKIYTEQELSRGVLVDMETDCWGCKRRDKVWFRKERWQRVKETMTFLDSEYNGNAEEFSTYMEGLSDKEYYKRFEHDIKKFSDEELVEEINRRAKSWMHSVGFETKAVIKNSK